MDIFFYRREEVVRISDKCRNEQGKIEVDIKEFEDKITELNKRKTQIDASFHNVEACKRNLQRHMKVVQDLQANAIG